MSIFYKQQAKKQIKLNIEHSNDIYEEIFKNIVPANNIFWIHDLKLEQDEDEINYYNLKRNSPATVFYARQLTELYFITHKISLDCEKNTDYVDFIFKKHFQNIINHINMLNNNIISLPEYNSNHYLIETHKTLIYLHKNILIEQQKILSYQQENINSL